jgi:hypothetical protein
MTITITSTNDAPVVVSEAVTTGTISGSVAANDGDVDTGDTAVYALSDAAYWLSDVQQCRRYLR